MTKEVIIAEIKRTTQANSGVPLGWRKFLSETGLAEGDWKCYWPRWSEAVREAGYKPRLLTTPYEPATLLEKYAQFALELGRLPTDADMRMRVRRDVTFPSDGPFRRLGSKPDIIRQVCDYARSRVEYAPVVRWCEEYASRRQPARDEGASAPTTTGSVYLLKSGRFYKLGRSNAAGRREYEIGIQLPEELKAVHVIKTDDPVGIEAYWHKRFGPKRKKGEWFDLDGADVRAFKKRKFM